MDKGETRLMESFMRAIMGMRRGSGPGPGCRAEGSQSGMQATISRSIPPCATMPASRLHSGHSLSVQWSWLCYLSLQSSRALGSMLEDLSFQLWPRSFADIELQRFAAGRLETLTMAEALHLPTTHPAWSALCLSCLHDVKHHSMSC